MRDVAAPDSSETPRDFLFFPRSSNRLTSVSFPDYGSGNRESRPPSVTTSCFYLRIRRRSLNRELLVPGTLLRLRPLCNTQNFPSSLLPAITVAFTFKTLKIPRRSCPDRDRDQRSPPPLRSFEGSVGSDIASDEDPISDRYSTSEDVQTDGLNCLALATRNNKYGTIVRRPF